MRARPAERRRAALGATLALLCGIAVWAAAGGQHPADGKAGGGPSTRSEKPARSTRRVTPSRLEQALRSNPNNEADRAECRPATRPDRHRLVAVFGRTRRPLFVCAVTLAGRPQATFDFQVLANGCFVGHRRRPGVADYGCVR